MLSLRHPREKSVFELNAQPASEPNRVADPTMADEKKVDKPEKKPRKPRGPTRNRGDVEDPKEVTA